MDWPTHKYRVNGIELSVVVTGNGPDVLLVHGFPDNHTVWRHQIPALVAAGYRVIAPDTRGCGDSQIAPKVADYALPTLVADLAALLDTLGVAKVRLVAHDWGAVIAWQFCFAHPEMVDRYVALSVGHPTAYAAAPLEQKLKGYYVLLLQLRGIIEWALKAGHWKLFRIITRFPQETPRWIASLSRPGRLTAAINYYRANLGLVRPRRYPKPQIPIMGVWSDGDIFLCEAQMVETARHVAGPWRYERVMRANHWLQLTAPEAVNALLLDYLT